MPRTKLPKLGRPLTEDEPLVHRICGYFSHSENAMLFRVAEQLTKKEGARVTVAEVVRRAVRVFVAKL